MQVWLFTLSTLVFLGFGLHRWISHIWSGGCICLPDLLTVVSLLAGCLMNDVRRYDPTPSHTIQSLFQQYLYIMFVRTYCRYLEWTFNKLSINCKKQQEDLLFDILNQNNDTVLFKDFNLQGVTTVDEYRKRLPLTTYDNYKKYVDLICEENPPDIMFPGQPDLIALTSGTSSGKSKGYPKCPVARKKVFIPWIMLTQRKISQVPGMNRLKKWYLPSVASKTPPTKSGVPTGPISNVLHKTLPSFVAAPRTGIHRENEAAYVGLLFAIQEPDLTYFGAPVSSNILTVCSVLENKWKSLCDDVERGCVSKDVEISDEDRRFVNSKLKKNPKRAKELRKLFSQGFQAVIPRLWKGVPGVFALTTGVFKTQAEILKQRYLGHLPIHSMLHVGTETLYGLNFNPVEQEAEYVAMITINMFEFIPEDEMSEQNPSTVLAHQVEVGKAYEVVISTHDGLYRYRTADIVEITGFFNTVPKYKFLRRAGDILSTTLEKIPECLLSEALYESAMTWKNGAIENLCSVEGMHVEKVLGEFSGDNYYVTFLEMEDDIQPNPGELSRVDDALQQKHDVYRAMRNNRRLKPLRIYLVQKGTFNKLKLALMESNPDAYCMQVKIPRIIRKEDLIQLLLESRV